MHPLLTNTAIKQTPLYYGWFIWSGRVRNSYSLYLCNADTSVIWTLSSFPLVSILKKFDCTSKKHWERAWRIRSCETSSFQLVLLDVYVHASLAATQASAILMQDKIEQSVASHIVFSCLLILKRPKVLSFFFLRKLQTAALTRSP